MAPKSWVQETRERNAKDNRTMPWEKSLSNPNGGAKGPELPPDEDRTASGSNLCTYDARAPQNNGGGGGDQD